MSKSDRLFQLTNLLRAYQPVTAKQLAEKMMLSERTIYRYIDCCSGTGAWPNSRFNRRNLSGSHANK